VNQGSIEAQLQVLYYSDKFFCKSFGSGFLLLLISATWPSYWEKIPEIYPQTRVSLGDRRNQFNKFRTKYDPNGMFFDNESLKRVLLGAGDDANLDE